MGFGLRALGFGLWVLGLGLRASGFGLLGFGLWVLGLGLRASGFGLLGFGLWVLVSLRPTALNDCHRRYRESGTTSAAASGERRQKAIHRAASLDPKLPKP